VSIRNRQLDGMTLEQVFKAVMAKYPSGDAKIIGTVNPLPFRNCRVSSVN
jgi:hypothetical protein